MREFYKLYAMGLDSKEKAGCLDSLNCFASFGGDTKVENSKVTTQHVHDQLLDTFGLDVNLNETFGISQAELNQDDFKVLVGTHNVH